MHARHRTATIHANEGHARAKRWRYAVETGAPGQPTGTSRAGEGTGGADLTNSYDYSITEDLDVLHGDCGGGWMVYWGQSWPGFNNAATDTTGGPMMNWWPFVFY